VNEKLINITENNNGDSELQIDFFDVSGSTLCRLSPSRGLVMF